MISIDKDKIKYFAFLYKLFDGFCWVFVDKDDLPFQFFG